MTKVDVLVIGTGQAGLAAGYHLRKTGLDFAILDGAARVGDNWRKRYASLTLFTPRQFSALPGLAMKGNREGYPTRDEFADYLEAYARTFNLPLHLGCRVVRLSKPADRYEALLSNGSSFVAGAVVIATGGFQLPTVPAIAASFSSEVSQLTAESYRSPDDVPPGTVLVVGDGASGRDIAAELSRVRPTLLATGKPRRLFPERILGKSVWWWLSLFGVMRAAADSFIGRRVRAADAFPDRDRSIGSLQRMGVHVVSRLTAVDGAVATFADGSRETVATVIWCVGYRDDSDWVAIDAAKDNRGTFLHNEGVSPVAGLYFVGRPWQRNRASALVMGVGDDAALIVARIAGHERSGALS